MNVEDFTTLAENICILFYLVSNFTTMVKDK